VDQAQCSLFGQAPRADVICRTSQAKEPIEWQADSFAASLLMPRFLVYGVWHERFGNTKSRILKRKDRIPLNTIDDPALRSAFAATEQGRDDAVLERFVQPMAARFRVSPIAMRIRLEKLGLLQREVPRQHDLAAPV
jgi:Zn-dependent peptidase ImmA (M78 family)